jgi:dTDP-4-amino-4,6-dideoxygalactose transaminase
MDILAIKGGLPVREDLLIFGKPDIREPEIQEVVSSLKSGWISTGPKVAHFEEMFRDYKGAKFAIAVNSGSAALHLSLLAAEVNPGDEVITSPMTFCSTVNSIIHTGATPVIVDCDRITMNIDPGEIKKKITKRTKAIIPVHFAGYPCEMDIISNIAKKYELKVIEDCAHAIESEYQGKRAGTFGQFGCFSFYVTKNVITGEGGMVITNSEESAGLIKSLAIHGMSKDAWKRFSDEGYKHYSIVSPGFKYNMMDMQAALGIHHLKRVETSWERRKEIWKQYNDSLGGLPLHLPSEGNQSIKHGYHLYTILLDVERLTVNRDYILDALTKENIGLGVHYLSISSHQYYQKRYGWNEDDCPNAKWIGERTISLPLSSGMSDKDVNDVITAVKKVLSYFVKT